MSSAKWRPFCLSPNVLMGSGLSSVYGFNDQKGWPIINNSPNATITSLHKYITLGGLLNKYIYHLIGKCFHKISSIPAGQVIFPGKPSKGVHTLWSAFWFPGAHKLRSYRQPINSLRLCDAYIHQWIGSVLLQVMACRLFGTKPLPEPMLTYWQLDP